MKLLSTNWYINIFYKEKNELYTLLIVEEDDDLRPILVEQLQIHKEFEVLQAKTAEAGIIIAREKHIDLAILSIEFSDLDGHTAVKKLRSQKFRAPIIMITNHNTNCDILLDLETGANDYVTKPFRFAVLLARIRGNCANTSKTTMQFSHWSL
ncbi:Transcriptional regulatory protein AfsQ1 [Bartonella vinsonii]|uniref:Transcriptional regulatory protein AfsQ1 n=1 Tax=Bartonella vinsonii TaxID=33047 RepID=A0A448V449_BARVI|nr:Transcriptional regulatory protein AfsQ1 [Bartonella vinsonii]